MNIKQLLAALTLGAVLGSPTWGQATSASNPHGSGSLASSAAFSAWSFSLTADGYVVPHSEFFVSPIFTADRGWLHLEGRYNDEGRQTGSVWLGFNFSAGHKLGFEFIPFLGAVFSHPTVVHPCYELSPL